MAANPEVRVGLTNPDIHFQQNLVAIHNRIESIRKTRTNPTIIFTSTSTVYGEPTKISTPENYAPLKRTEAGAIGGGMRKIHIAT